MNNTIIFLSIFILILSTMLNFKITLILDIDNNSIIIHVKLYFIQLITINVSLLGFYYQINNSKKLKKFNLISIEDAYLVKQIKRSVFDKLYYDNIVFRSNIGLSSAKATAITSSIIDVICNNFYKFSKNKNNSLDFEYYNYIDFCYSKIYFKIDLNVYFTIFDLIFALVVSFLKRGKYVKEKRKSRKYR